MNYSVSCLTLYKSSTHRTPAKLFEMKKAILLVSVLMSTGFSYAGDICEKKDGETTVPKWYVGKSISPEWNFYKSADNKQNTDFGKTCGFRIEYNFCNYIGLVAGVQFSQKTFNTRVLIPKVTTSTGEEVTNAQQVTNSVKIIEVPVGVRFRSDCCTKTCKCTGWTFTPVKYIGVNAITAFSSDQTYVYNQGKETFDVKDNGVTSFTVVPEIGLGLEVGFCERMKFIFMPKFRYDVIKLSTKNASAIPNNHKLALEASLNFSF